MKLCLTPLLFLLAACEGATLSTDPASTLRGRNGATETCVAGEYLCQGDDIVECQADGSTAVVTGCAAIGVSTCKFCPGQPTPECTATDPLARGSVVGTPNPIEVWVDGCGLILAELNVVDGPSAKALLFSLLGGNGEIFRLSAWTYNDSSHKTISPGVEFPFNETNARLAVKIGACENQQAALVAPYPGSARVTWTSTEIGADVHYEAEGPVTCDGGASWQDIRVDIRARVTDG